MKASPEKILRWCLQGALVLLVIAVIVAYMQYAKTEELQAALDQQKQDAAGLAASAKKTADALGALKTKAADTEHKLADADQMKSLLSTIEPQIKSVLEAAAGAKGAKPDARANALAAEGIVGQVVHGAGDADALALLDRALGADKANCAAAAAINASGTKKVEPAAECPQPAAAAAPASTPAAPAATSAAGATPTAASPAATSPAAPKAPASAATPAAPAAGAAKAATK